MMTDNAPEENSSFRKYEASSIKEGIRLIEKIRDRLWIGNGTGAVTVLTSLQPQNDLIFIIPFSFFSIGLIALGFGSYIELLWVRKKLKNIENNPSPNSPYALLNMKTELFQKPSEQIVLRWVDQISILTFLLGIISGILLVFLAKCLNRLTHNFMATYLGLSM